MGRVVVFGATGFTGRLTLQALQRLSRVDVVAAGRNPQRLSELAGSVPGTRTAQVVSADDLAVLLGPEDVLVTTVGPFGTRGHIALEAAIQTGCTYIDCAGEPAFHREVFSRYAAQAKETGATLLTGMAADWLPGNLIGALLLREFGHRKIKSIVIEYVITGPVFEFSAGSIRTGQESAAAGGGGAHAFRQGQLQIVANETRSMATVDGPVLGRRVGSTEPLTLPRLEPTLINVDVFIAYPPPADAASSPADSRHPLGPSPESRARNAQVVTAKGYGADGRLVATAGLLAANGYDYTAETLAWASNTAAHRRPDIVGAAGPVEVYGLDGLLDYHRETGCEVWSAESSDAGDDEPE